MSSQRKGNPDTDILCFWRVAPSALLAFRSSSLLLPPEHCPSSHQLLLLSSKHSPPPPPPPLTRRVVSGVLAPEDRTPSPHPLNPAGWQFNKLIPTQSKRHKNKTSLESTVNNFTLREGKMILKVGRGKTRKVWNACPWETPHSAGGRTFLAD